MSTNLETPQRNKTPDYTSDEFILPATLQEKEIEYAPFTDAAEATHWLQRAAKIFGTSQTTNNHEYTTIYNDKPIMSREWKGLPENEDLAKKLGSYGISAHTDNQSDMVYVKDKHGNPQTDRGGNQTFNRLHDDQLFSAFSITDDKGGQYTFSSNIVYPQRRHDQPLAQPQSGEYNLSYVTGVQGYGMEAEAKFKVGDKKSQSSTEEADKFVAMASDFKNLLVSKLAMNDPEAYKLLDEKKLIDYGQYE